MSISYCIVTIIILVLSICASSISGQKISTNNTRIIGGHRAEKPIPYQISLQVRVKRPMFSIPFLTETGDYAHICGGSILSKSYILTAAHCVDQQNPASLTVLVGTSKRNSGGTRHEVESFVMHPEYQPLKTGDIALIKVKKPFQMTRTINTIRLGEDYVGGNVPVKLSGWGYTRSITFGNLPEHLQTIDLKTITNDECSKEGFNVTDGEICTYKGFLQGACAGDSGGPLVNSDRTEVIGVVSYGTQICSIGYPDAFTRVSNYIPWIREQMKDEAPEASATVTTAQSANTKLVFTSV